MNTQFANVATPSEIVVALTFTIELGGNSSEMHFCIPYSMVEPIRDILYSTMHSEQAGTDRRWSSMLARQLQLAEVELVVPLTSCEMTLSGIAELKVGDIIPIHIEDHVPATVDGIPVMDCRYGIRDGQYALKVERFLAQDEAEQA
jgi:flagellar motor switch protein FliM